MLVTDNFSWSYKLLANDIGKQVAELTGRNWKEMIDEAGFMFVTFNCKTGEIFNKRTMRSYDIALYPPTDSRKPGWRCTGTAHHAGSQEFFARWPFRLPIDGPPKELEAEQEG